MKYLGIDWGEARIGLAIGDDELKIASPFEVVGDINQVLKIVKEEGIDVVVLGEPLKMSGKNEFLESYISFCNKFKKALLNKVEVVMHDERLTSKGADALPGTKKTKAPQDAIAAMLTLQNFFDKIEIQ